MTAPRLDPSRNDAAERFVAGEDRLSALLRDLPRYEAPAGLAATVVAAARAVQARVAVETERDVARASAPAPTFTAPPTLSSSVLGEAARLQAAQAARRDVVFDQVLQGKPAADVLGAQVGEATEAWLRTQAAQLRDTPGPAAPAPLKPTLSRWWKSLGVAASAFAVAGLATKLVLSQLDDGTPMTASLSSTVNIADPASPAPQREPMLAPSPAPSVAQTTPSSVQAAPETPSTRAAQPVRRPTTPSPQARKERAPAPAADVAPTPAPLAPLAPPAAPMASMQAQSDPVAHPPPAAAPAPAVAAEQRARRLPQSTYMAAPAPAAAETARSATVTLEDDPASVAMQWRPGKGLKVWSAEPGNAAVRDWVARLWAAMPAEARPVAPYGIERDEALARGQLRIEQGTQHPGVK